MMGPRPAQQLRKELQTRPMELEQWQRKLGYLATGLVLELMSGARLVQEQLRMVVRCREMVLGRGPLRTEWGLEEFLVRVRRLAAVVDPGWGLMLAQILRSAQEKERELVEVKRWGRTVPKTGQHLD
jgi:hypothetical protein